MKWKRFHRRIQLEERDNELYINFPSQSEEAEDNASRSLSITDIVSLYLRYLKSTAEAYSGASISGVVLSCQSLHTKQAAQRLRSAAEKADLPLWSILEEPVAAYLGCRFPLSSNPTDDRYFLMIDMGAMATRFTLLAQRSGVFVTVAQHEHADFSGLKLDLLLKDHFAVEFKRKYRLDISESWKSEMKLLYGVGVFEGKIYFCLKLLIAVSNAVKRETKYFLVSFTMLMRL
jgi:molecular chaperone DnaK (HSP70)